MSTSFFNFLWNGLSLVYISYPVLIHSYIAKVNPYVIRSRYFGHTNWYVYQLLSFSLMIFGFTCYQTYVLYCTILLIKNNVLSCLSCLINHSKTRKHYHLLSFTKKSHSLLSLPMSNNPALAGASWSCVVLQHDPSLYDLTTKTHTTHLTNQNRVPFHLWFFTQTKLASVFPLSI